ncbi:fungal-specific transcription factor domain-containing protein [Phyllosticta paracitricarpa]|uniref:Fungal-specific transcription factor domain-containing protein n=1 Tax=Phyllosticta paracitricarpa TaxID=2016321 RepID=A0ABR1N1K1_9PEZI
MRLLQLDVSPRVLSVRLPLQHARLQGAARCVDAPAFGSASLDCSFSLHAHVEVLARSLADASFFRLSCYSYVYYLESRIAYLHSLLRDHDIPFAPPEHFALSYKPPNGHAIFSVEKQAQAAAAAEDQQHHSPHVSTAASPNSDAAAGADANRRQEQRYDDTINKMVSNIGMVSVQGASDPRYLGSTSGISFARVVFTAVKSSVSGGASSEKSKPLPGAAVGNDGTSMRDSFFGLHTKPTIRQAPFPERELACRLVELYFEHANPQVPILHRGEYMAMFERGLATDPKERTSRELFMLNIVFAIGAGIILDSSDSHDRKSSKESPDSPPPGKRRRLSSIQQQPEEYYASAIVHLESFLGSSPAVDRPDGFGGGLEELQAVLLLAGFALLRPIAPGLWYIVGVAVRLGVDLGLHYEDGVGIDGATGEEARTPDHPENTHTNMDRDEQLDPKERGRRQWVRDLRRRLWWCVYSLDRLVSTCVGRPFGISDEVTTTEFPSSLDDRFITKEGFVTPAGGSSSSSSAAGGVKPTYKCVSYHYFRFRMMQSEILQVLQSRQAQQARNHRSDGFLHTDLPNPFLTRFGDSFVAWRRDIDRRLYEWKESAPTQLDTGVQFSPLFFELNYWQAVIMLYRPSLTVPGPLADELKSTPAAGEDEVGNSPSVLTNNSFDEREDDDFVFLKVAEAGQMTLKLYRQLHRVHLVNYTYLATHHLFMAGISFLYALWHSPLVRSHLSLDDVDFTVLAATSVLGDLTDKCPPAEACRDAFDRMSKATIQMCMSTTGFGRQALQHVARFSSALPQGGRSTTTGYASMPGEIQGQPQQQQQQRLAHEFMGQNQQQQQQRTSSMEQQYAAYQQQHHQGAGYFAPRGAQQQQQQQVQQHYNYSFSPPSAADSNNTNSHPHTSTITTHAASSRPTNKRPYPRFDMNLRDLFDPDEADEAAGSAGANAVLLRRPSLSLGLDARPGGGVALWQKQQQQNDDAVKFEGESEGEAGDAQVGAERDRERSATASTLQRRRRGDGGDGDGGSAAQHGRALSQQHVFSRAANFAAAGSPYTRSAVSTPGLPSTAGSQHQQQQQKQRLDDPEGDDDAVVRWQQHQQNQRGLHHHHQHQHDNNNNNNNNNNTFPNILDLGFGVQLSEFPELLDASSTQQHDGAADGVGGVGEDFGVGGADAAFGGAFGGHDWSDGIALDLFDAFFFGGGGGGQ